MVISSGLTVLKFKKFDQQVKQYGTHFSEVSTTTHARSVVLNLFRFATHFSAIDYNFSDTFRNKISECLCLSDKVMLFFLRNENIKLFGDTMAKNSRHNCVAIHCFRTTVLEILIVVIHIMAEQIKFMKNEKFESDSENNDKKSWHFFSLVVPFKFLGNFGNF